MTPESLPENPSVAILGAGSWGTALGVLLTHNASRVLLYGRDEEAIRLVNETHTNPRYLPGLTFDEKIEATDRLADTLDADLVVFVVPSAATRSVAGELAELGLKPGAILLCCSKGIELGTGKRMSEIVAEHFPDHPLAVLSGPNHAEEVSRGLASAAVIGCTDDPVAHYLQRVFTTPGFRTYTNHDIAGIELGGALKNVFAIASGIAKGLGLGDNATAALVTRGLAEMIRLGTKLGGHPDTFIGLSGVGDLMATCYSHHSRNFRAGISLGEGKSLPETLEAVGMVVEGIVNCESIHQAARRCGIRSPLIDAVYAVLHEDKEASVALRELLTRTPRSERD